MKNKKNIYIDMDGVLCEYREEASFEDMLQKGYFRNLAPRKDMVDAVNYLIESGENEVFVLSALIPEIEKDARKDKNDWLNEFLPAIDSGHRIFTLCGESKADAVGGISRNHILCDDYSHNLRQWQGAGGTAIKILNEVNGKGGTFTAGPRLRVTSKETLADAIRKIG